MKRNIVIAAVTATALLGGGATVAFAGNDDDGGRDEVRRTKITAADAAGAALKERPGTVVSVDLDDRDGDDDRGWEVEVLGQGTTSYTVHVNPDNGRILGTDRNEDDDDNDRGLLKGAEVDAAEAAKSAAAKGFVTSVDVDDDDRAAGWDVETVDSQGHEQHWTVDTKTGKVTGDRDDDNAED